VARRAKVAGNPQERLRLATPEKQTRRGVRKVIGLFRRPVVWVTTIVLAAAAAFAGTTLTGVFSTVVNQDHLDDQLAPGPDIQAIADIVQLDDQGSSVAMADDFQPTGTLLNAMHQTGAAASTYVVNSLKAAGGVNLRDLSIRIVLEGRRREQIRILNIAPVDVHRSSPPSGALFYAPPQGGGADLLMMTDFDQPRPAVDSILPADGPVFKPGRPYFDTNTISLTENEQQVIMYRATVTKYSVTFELQVDYLIGDQKKNLIITDSRHPFAVTGAHMNTADDNLSYRHIFTIDGAFQYCPVDNPQDFNVNTDVEC
jgi:hypothetical protein